tara:strand:+ start:322 stop:1149 length:828 start_codon:yes stop_codon:yes gene_type:complete
VFFKKFIKSLISTSEQDQTPWIQRRPGIEIKSSREIKLITETAKIVSAVLNEIKKEVKSNVSTLDINEYAEKLVRDMGAIPSYKGYSGYPTATCISINNEVLHGIPNKNRIIKEKDLIKIELGVLLNGFHANKSIIVPVGSIGENAKNLIKTNEDAINQVINIIKPGNTLLDIAGTVEDIVKLNGFSVVEDYTGSGIGRNLHEQPAIFNFRTNELPNIVLREGMTFTINPIINEGSKFCKTLNDQWTVITSDGKLSSNLRHTIAITKNGCEVLTK